MDTRTRRFVAAVVEGEFEGANRASEGLAGAGWDLRLFEAHPIGGEPMAVATGPNDSESRNLRRSGLPPAAGRAGLTLTAVRTDGAIEVSVGIVFHHSHRFDGRVPAGGRPVFIPPDVAPAYRGTAVVRCAWHVEGDAPDVVAFRGRYVPGREDEYLLHLWVELPDGWDEGVSDRPEAVLSGRAEAFGESDRLALGIPWLHEDRELALSFPLAGLHTAVAEVKALVSP